MSSSQHPETQTKSVGLLPIPRIWWSALRHSATTGGRQVWRAQQLVACTCLRHECLRREMAVCGCLRCAPSPDEHSLVARCLWCSDNVEFTHSTCCLDADEDYTLLCSDGYGDGWNGGKVSVFGRDYCGGEERFQTKTQPINAAGLPWMATYWVASFC